MRDKNAIFFFFFLLFGHPSFPGMVQKLKKSNKSMLKRLLCSGNGLSAQPF
jgi:hypothetical protein